MKRHPEHQYLDLLRDVLDNGTLRDDRTGTGTLGVFGRQIRFDLADGFPLLTTKKVHLRSIIVELLWFLRGETNAKWMEDQGVTIWKEWGDPDTREMGRAYPAQWRRWVDVTGTYGDSLTIREFDQVANVVRGLIDDPNGRRHLISAWNVADIGGQATLHVDGTSATVTAPCEMALPPCHCLFQFFVADGRLSCQLYQRSADLFLGVPFNIASYALLTMMVAQATGLEPGEFVHTFGDAHLYTNHIEQAELQIAREPRPFPTMTINPERRSLDLHRMGEWSLNDFALTGYDPHPAIKAEVSV